MHRHRGRGDQRHAAAERRTARDRDRLADRRHRGDISIGSARHRRSSTARAVSRSTASSRSPSGTHTTATTVSPLAPQPTKVDVTQVGNVTVTASDTTYQTDCSGLFGDITESLIGSAIGDVGALFAGGMQDFLNEVDGNGNTAIAGAIETALAGVDIAGPGAAVSALDLDAPFTAINGTETASILRERVGDQRRRSPGAPDLLAGYHVPGRSRLRHDVASAAPAVRHRARHLDVGLQPAAEEPDRGRALPGTITGSISAPVRSRSPPGLLGALFTPFNQIPPATPISIRVSPTIAPVLTGDPGPAGELGELRASHIRVASSIRDAGQPSNRCASCSRSMRVSVWNLAFQPGGIGFALSTPTASDADGGAAEESAGRERAALQGFCPSVLAGFAPDPQARCGNSRCRRSRPLAVRRRVSRNGQYYAIFADQDAGVHRRLDVSPSGVCLAGACQAASCGDAAERRRDRSRLRRRQLPRLRDRRRHRRRRRTASSAGARRRLPARVHAERGSAGAACGRQLLPRRPLRRRLAEPAPRPASTAAARRRRSTCAAPTARRAAPAATARRRVQRGRLSKHRGCADGLKNGNQTDVDCGGASCPGCGLGKVRSRERLPEQRYAAAPTRAACGNRGFTFTMNSNTGGAFSSAWWFGRDGDVRRARRPDAASPSRGPRTSTSCARCRALLGAELRGLLAVLRRRRRSRRRLPAGVVPPAGIGSAAGRVRRARPRSTAPARPATSSPVSVTTAPPPREGSRT